MGAPPFLVRCHQCTPSWPSPRPPPLPPTLHALVIPRTAAITARALAVVEEVWSGKWAPSDEEAAAVAGRVRAEIGRLLAS